MAGAEVTVCVRPECWTLSHEAPATNAVKGRIGAATYLGEVAQYDFVTSGTTLKMLELNPRFIDQSGRGDVYAGVAAEDVVVLLK